MSILKCENCGADVNLISLPELFIEMGGKPGTRFVQSRDDPHILVPRDDPNARTLESETAIVAALSGNTRAE